MGGMIILSSSGAERREAWWERLRAAETRWELVLPTARAGELMRARYPFWQETFAAVTTLEALALREGAALLPEGALDESALMELLLAKRDAARTAAHAILGWQRAGYATSYELPDTSLTSAAAALWAELEARSGGPIKTAPWAMVMLSRTPPTAWTTENNLYLEHFATASAAEIELLHAYSDTRSVMVRVRDLVEVPVIEAVFQPFVETLATHAEWTGQQDEPPRDALERQALAEFLFATSGSARPARPAELGAREARFMRADAVAAELAAIGLRAAELVQGGALASSLAVALPDTEAYRAAALELPPGALRMTHADLAAWTGANLFLGGLDGGFELPQPDTDGDETLIQLPTHLLDGIENALGTLWLSAVGEAAANLADALLRLSPRPWS